MVYAKYFSVITSENGQPNLDADQFRRMMNIVFVEGVIAGITKIKEQGSDTYFKYDVLLFKQKSILRDLTDSLEPEILLKEMYRLSGC